MAPLGSPMVIAPKGLPRLFLPDNSSTLRRPDGAVPALFSLVALPTRCNLPKRDIGDSKKHYRRCGRLARLCSASADTALPSPHLIYGPGCVQLSMHVKPGLLCYQNGQTFKALFKLLAAVHYRRVRDYYPIPPYYPALQYHPADHCRRAAHYHWAAAVSAPAVGAVAD